MCGISAIVRLDGDAAMDLADLDCMHRAQKHRGPDGKGAFTIDRRCDGRRFERVPVLHHDRPAELSIRAARSGSAARIVGALGDRAGAGRRPDY